MPKYFEEDSLDEEFDLMEVTLDGEETFDADGEEAEGFAPEDFEALGIDPYSPTRARPGSEAKVIMLSARYAAGLPLWHDEDCYEHGPREIELMGPLGEIR